MHKEGEREIGRRAIFWDWTGTLADEAEFDSALCGEIGEKVGASAYKGWLKRQEGTWHWFDYTAHFSRAGLDWKRAHLKHRGKLRLVGGAKSALGFCRRKGYVNCLLTNAVKPVIDFRLKLTGCSKYFELVVGCDEAMALKETGRHLNLAMHLLKLEEPGGCIAVGDNPVQDLAPARRLGIRSVLCEYGRGMTHYHTSHIAGNHDFRFRPDYTIGSLSELKPILSSRA